MKTWFTSDTHFGHGLIKDTRPFATVEEHDEHLIEQINACVAYNDRLYILGDFAFRAADSYAAKIKCPNKHLVWGNHDKQSFSKWFKTVSDVAEVRVDGKHYFWLSHYTHAYWPRSHRGGFHLYGHNHGEHEDIMDAAFPGRRSMDACVDTAKRLFGELRPMEAGELAEIFLARPGHYHPHTNKEVQDDSAD